MLHKFGLVLAISSISVSWCVTSALECHESSAASQSFNPTCTKEFAAHSLLQRAHHTTMQHDERHGLSAKTSQTCTKFVLLSMQRSGSSFTERELRKQHGVNMTGEGFNFGYGQAGDFYSKLLGVDENYVKEMGSEWWSHQILSHLEGSADTVPCAVGFRAFEGAGNEFGSAWTQALLDDTTIKKIILERKDTWAQWVSWQRACWYDDWNGHHGSDNRKGQKAKTLERINNGETCGWDEYSNFDKYQEWKAAIYQRWYDVMLQTGQVHLKIDTETLDTHLAKMVEFVLPAESASAFAQQAFSPFDIETDDE